MGCSELSSRALASRNTSSELYCLSTDSIRVTPKSPLVNVPVLSKSKTEILRDSSKAVRFRINKPFCADTAVDIATTNGIANPNACGQAITITVTILSKAYTNGNPKNNQTASVPKPIANAI